MKFLLSFAIGAILGDIFFHLIPESYQSHLTELNDSKEDAHKKVGVSIIAGIFMFIIVEMIIEKWSGAPPLEDTDILLNDKGTTDKINSYKFRTNEEIDYLKQAIPIFNNTSARADLKRNSPTDEIFRDIPDTNNNSCGANSNHSVKTIQNVIVSDDSNNNESATIINAHLKYRKKEGPMSKAERKSKGDISGLNDPKSTLKHGLSTTKLITIAPTASISIDSAGYLNLIANGFDNFTHGLAIGASFLIGPKVGFLTTFVIIIHEIPHEICDYAILVNSGFSRWDAVKAQSSVSLFGIIGTATALYVKSVETLNAKTLWILPFSAGGFLYIALVNLLPEILDRKTDLRNTLGQVTCVMLGIIFMAVVAIF